MPLWREGGTAMDAAEMLIAESARRWKVRPALNSCTELLTCMILVDRGGRLHHTPLHPPSIPLHILTRSHTLTHPDTSSHTRRSRRETTATTSRQSSSSSLALASPTPPRGDCPRESPQLKRETPALPRAPGAETPPLPTEVSCPAWPWREETWRRRQRVRS